MISALDVNFRVLYSSGVQWVATPQVQREINLVHLRQPCGRQHIELHWDGGSWDLTKINPIGILKGNFLRCHQTWPGKSGREINKLL